MVYVMSDIHGEYELFTEMLEKICFSDEDELYILGDICDRGEKPMSVYLDIINRQNVFALRGNHEDMAISCLEYLAYRNEISIDEPDFYDSLGWLYCGGSNTVEDFNKLSVPAQKRICSYIRSLPYYRSITVCGTEYLLVHAGLGNYEKTRPIESYSEKELVWSEIDYDSKLWDGENKKMIVGHTPTFYISKSGESKIYHGKGDIIAIDCGATFTNMNGRLACLCLDTMQEFYVRGNK